MQYCGTFCRWDMGWNILLVRFAFKGDVKETEIFFCMTRLFFKKILPIVLFFNNFA